MYVHFLFNRLLQLVITFSLKRELLSRYTVREDMDGRMDDIQSPENNIFSPSVNGNIVSVRVENMLENMQSQGRT